MVVILYFNFTPNMRWNMTLHEAIVDLLKQRNQEMSTQQISDELNRIQTYEKRDGSSITAYQIHGRTKNYPHLFYRKGSTVGLNEWVANKKSSSIPNVSQSDKTETDFNMTNVVTKKSSLNNMGFTEIGTIDNIFLNGLSSVDEIKECGIHAITIPENYQVDLISPEETLRMNNVINPWDLTRLKEKWVNKVDIVYYGLAGAKSFRSLSERLNDLVNHGKGYTTNSGPHKGGEILWQLQDYKKFSIWILPTSEPPIPRNIENMLLKRFHQNTGKLPFANRQF